MSIFSSTCYVSKRDPQRVGYEEDEKDSSTKRHVALGYWLSKATVQAAGSNRWKTSVDQCHDGNVMVPDLELSGRFEAVDSLDID